jgi:hypothetical protein
MFKNFKFLIIFLIILVVAIIFSSYFIWQNNSKINQNSQIQPLVADSEYDVVVLEKCDLAMRFVKKIPNSSIKLDFVGGLDKNSYYGAIKPKDNNSNEFKQFSIVCSQIVGDNEIKFLTKQQLQQKLSETEKNSLFFKTFIDLPIEKISKDSNVLVFQHKNKNILITWQNDNNFNETINLNQVQIQPNSLAPSTPSVKL